MVLWVAHLSASLRRHLHYIKVCSKMPGQNATTAEILLHKINDAELKLCGTLHKKLSWHSVRAFWNRLFLSLIHI